MTILWIDGKEAVLAAGTSFKVTRENTLLTDAGDYTFDISLPLEGCVENQRIFGAAHRMEQGKKKLAGQEYTFHLVSPPLDLQGTAVVTSVSDTAVKVQLLAGRSAINLEMTGKDGKELYIDELDLGTAYEAEFRRVYGPDVEQTMERTMDMMWREGDMFTIIPELAMYGSSDDTDCCCFPIYSTADGEASNQRSIADFYTSDKSWSAVVIPSTGNVLDKSFWNWPLSEGNEKRPDLSDRVKVPKSNIMAPQPYFCFIIEQVVRALGYELDRKDNAIRQSWMRNILIANARGTLKFNQLLPHWTVKEFFQEVQTFFGVVVQVEGKRVRVERKAAIYQDKAHVRTIRDVMDEYSVDMDEEAGQKDPAGGNVGYAYPEIDKKLVLPDEVFELATVKHFADYGALLDFVRGTPEEERAKSSVLMIDDGLGYKWAFINQDGKYINQVVDQMSALYRDDRRELDTELKIVPVRMDYPVDAVSRMIFIHSVGMDKDRYVHKRTEKVKHIIMVTDDTRVVTGYDGYSINDAVSGDGAETDTNKRDVIEVAVNTPDYWKIWFEDGITDKSQRSWNVPVPVGNPYIQDLTTGAYHTILKRYSFVLDYKGTDESGNVYGTETIRHDVLEGYKPADTRVQWVVSFLDDGAFEPGDLYVIRNKKYLCQKLEFTINEDGVSPLKKGYFYEVSE